MRIAAAYALANGAADAKRRRDAKLKGLKTAQREPPSAEGGPAPDSSAAASAGGACSEALAATSDTHSSATPGAAVPKDDGAVISGAQDNDVMEVAGPTADTGSPQRSARVLELQPSTPHPYRINPEFYRAGSGGLPTGRPGTVRFSDADAATFGVVDADSAVPLPSSHRLAGSGMQPAAGAVTLQYRTKQLQKLRLRVVWMCGCFNGRRCIHIPGLLRSFLHKYALRLGCPVM